MPDDKPHLPEPPGTDPFPEKWIGLTVRFDHPVGGPVADRKRLVGTVEAQRYVGRTARGGIPDYALRIRGASGKVIETSLVESYASVDLPR